MESSKFHVKYWQITQQLLEFEPITWSPNNIYITFFISQLLFGQEDPAHMSN